MNESNNIHGHVWVKAPKVTGNKLQCAKCGCKVHGDAAKKPCGDPVYVKPALVQFDPYAM